MADAQDNVESVDETLHSGSAQIEASRRLIDALDQRLSRGSEILAAPADQDSNPPD